VRILMLSDVFFPRVNGVSTSMATFKKEFKKKGHEVTCVVPNYDSASRNNNKNDNSSPSYFSTMDQTLIRIPSRYVFVDPEDRMMKASKVLALTKQLKTKQFDLLHIQTPFIAHYTGIKLAKALNIPAVETYHTYFEEYLYHYVHTVPKAWLRYAARRFTRTQCSRVDAVVVPSSAMFRTLREYGVNNRIEIIPTGIDYENFHFGDGLKFRQQYAIAKSRPTLVHVGRLAFEKNVEFLLHVLVEVRRRIPDVLLILAGEGPASEKLKHIGHRLGLQDHLLFVGNLDREKGLQDCYCAGDALIFASRTETQGLVLLEAMALGVPVVSTAIMGTKDILSHGRGVLIAENDVQDFTEKVVNVLHDPVLREKLGREGKDYAKTWSAEVMADKMLTFYSGVVEQFHSSATSLEQSCEESS
jgi:1,2-diacylglycerol 3-alpha-glucosyltransferase